MKILLFSILCSAFPASGQVPAIPPEGSGTSIRVVASEMIWVGELTGGTKVTGLIDGQPVVLREFKERNPIAPGNYKIRLTHDENPHGSEMDRRYILTLQDGKQLTFYLEALCERDAHTCYGVSLR